MALGHDDEPSGSPLGGAGRDRTLGWVGRSLGRGRFVDKTLLFEGVFEGSFALGCGIGALERTHGYAKHRSSEQGTAHGDRDPGVVPLLLPGPP
jgi:hypothetical protein